MTFFLGFSSIGSIIFTANSFRSNNTWRLYNRNTPQINYQSSQQLSQIQQFKGRLAQATTEEDMNQLFAALNPQERSPEIKNTEGFQKKLLAEIGKAEKIVTTQS